MAKKSLLNRLLEKRGIKSTDQLSVDEKSQFENWNRVLSKEELSLEDVKSFCANQIDIIEAKWKDYSLDDAKKASLIPYYTVYKTILGAIGSPQTAREALEKYLQQLIES